MLNGISKNDLEKAETGIKKYKQKTICDQSNFFPPKSTLKVFQTYQIVLLFCRRIDTFFIYFNVSHLYAIAVFEVRSLNLLL